MAKNYKISKISDGVRIWTENGNGMYSTLGQLINKHIMDFFCVPNSTIKEVVRKSDGETFKCGDKLGDGSTSIINFRFANKVVIINNGLGSQTILDVAVKYVAPVPQPAAIAPVITDGIFKAIQESISKERPVRLEKLLKRYIPVTLEEFLIKFFQDWNEKKNTIYVDTEEVQTMIKKRRSLQDIFLICRYYFPSCTLKEVMTLLQTVLPKKASLRSSFCGVIKRKTYYWDGRESIVANAESKDEWGYRVKDYKQAIK